jgi:hypothetical protein
MHHLQGMHLMLIVCMVFRGCHDIFFNYIYIYIYIFFFFSVLHLLNVN